MDTTRFQLFDLVWSKPMREAASELGVSGTGLRKICVRNRVPVPEVGYWNRPEHKRTARTRMKDPTKDWPINIAVVPPRPRPPREQCELVDAPVMPDKLLAPHASTTAVRKLLEKATPDRYGGVRCDSAPALAARINPASLDRYLLLLDTVLKQALARGCVLKAPDGEAHPALFHDNEIITGFVEESASQRAHKLTPRETENLKKWGSSYAPVYDYVPSGVFRLSIGQHHWKDRAGRGVEDYLGEIISALLDQSRIIKERRRIAEEERAARQRERIEKWRRERRAELFGEERKRLEAHAERWLRAKTLRAYLEALQRQAPQDEEWLTWARKHVEQLDPLSQQPSYRLPGVPEDEQPPRDWPGWWGY